MRWHMRNRHGHSVVVTWFQACRLYGISVNGAPLESACPPHECPARLFQLGVDVPLTLWTHVADSLRLRRNPRWKTCSTLDWRVDVEIEKIGTKYCVFIDGQKKFQGLSREQVAALCQDLAVLVPTDLGTAARS